MVIYMISHILKQTEGQERYTLNHVTGEKVKKARELSHFLLHLLSSIIYSINGVLPIYK